MRAYVYRLTFFNLDAGDDIINRRCSYMLLENINALKRFEAFPFYFI